MKNTNKQVDISKRKALLGATATAAVAGVWHKPIVNAVMLPAHAQTSVALPESFFQAGTGGVFGGASDDSKPNFSPLDLFIKPAYAGDELTPEQFALLATQETEETYAIQILTPIRAILWVGTLNIDGTVADLTQMFTESCNDDIGFGSTAQAASIISIDQTEIQILLTGPGVDIIEDITLFAPAGEGPLNLICDGGIGNGDNGNGFNGNGNGVNGFGNGVNGIGNGVNGNGNGVNGFGNGVNGN